MKAKAAVKHVESFAIKKTRQYRGPAKGSDEAKMLMAKVRAAQWAKNGLVSNSSGATNDTQPEAIDGGNVTAVASAACTEVSDVKS